MDPKLGAEGRKDLFDWLVKRLSGLNDFPDAVHLLKPAAISMTVLFSVAFLFCLNMKYQVTQCDWT